MPRWSILFWCTCPKLLLKTCVGTIYMVSAVVSCSLYPTQRNLLYASTIRQNYSISPRMGIDSLPICRTLNVATHTIPTFKRTFKNQNKSSIRIVTSKETNKIINYMTPTHKTLTHTRNRSRCHFFDNWSNLTRCSCIYLLDFSVYV